MKYLLIIFGVLFSQVVMSQTDEALGSKKVKDAIYIGLSKADPSILVYRIDDPLTIAKSHPFPASFNIASSDESFNIMFEFLNPLRYNITTTETSSKDPAIENTNQFLSTLVTFLNQMGGVTPSTVNQNDLVGGEADSKTHLQEVTENSSKYIKVSKNKSETIDLTKINIEILSKVKSPELLNLCLWLLSDKENCLNAKTKLTLIASLADTEESVVNFQSSAKGLLTSMLEPSKLEELNESLSTFESSLKDLEKLNTKTEESYKLLDGITKSSSWKKDAFCNILQTYNKNNIESYIRNTSDILELRKQTAGTFKGLLENLRSLQKRGENENFLVSTIAVEPGFIKDVVVKVIKRDINTEDGIKVTISEKEDASKSIRVRALSRVITEFGAGILFTNLSFPRYGTDVINGQQVVTRAGDDRVTFIPATMLNIIINAGKSFIHPLIQLGIATGQNRPSLFVGTGARAIKPLNHFAFSLGPIWSWEQRPDKLILNESIVTGTADIERDLKYFFKERPAFYLGIQYSF